MSSMSAVIDDRSYKLALLGAIGLHFISHLPLGFDLQLHPLKASRVLVLYGVVAFLLVGHLEDKMEEIVIQLDVGLLVVVLADLQRDPVLGRGHFHLLPYLETALQVHPDPQDETAVHQDHCEPISDYLSIADASILDHQSPSRFHPGQLYSQD